MREKPQFAGRPFGIWFCLGGRPAGKVVFKPSYTLLRDKLEMLKASSFAKASAFI